MFDDFLSTLGEEQQRVLRAMIDEVTAIAPEAVEGRSYGLPAFRYRDRPLLGFGAAKKHLSLHPFSPDAIDQVRDRLEGFDVSKGTIRFNSDRSVPSDVLVTIVRRRMAEIDRA